MASQPRRMLLSCSISEVFRRHEKGNGQTHLIRWCCRLNSLKRKQHRQGCAETGGRLTPPASYPAPNRRSQLAAGNRSVPPKFECSRLDPRLCGFSWAITQRRAPITSVRTSHNSTPHPINRFNHCTPFVGQPRCSSKRSVAASPPERYQTNSAQRNRRRAGRARVHVVDRLCQILNGRGGEPPQPHGALTISLPPV